MAALTVVLQDRLDVFVKSHGRVGGESSGGEKQCN
jgi:hypothetical protein